MIHYALNRLSFLVWLIDIVGVFQYESAYMLSSLEIESCERVSGMGRRLYHPDSPNQAISDDRARPRGHLHRALGHLLLVDGQGR